MLFRSPASSLEWDERLSVRVRIKIAMLDLRAGMSC